ncbi:hypothetical protein ACFE04_012619 [Oxalis oulophora]
MPPLNSKHHALVQSLLTRGPLTENDFHNLFNGVTGRNPRTNKQYFNDYLLQINKELSLFQFEVRACRNQYDGQVWHGMVNNVSDDQSKLGTKYSAPQLALYKGILEAILQEGIGQGSISSFDALHVRLENQVQTGMGSESQSQGVPAAIRNFSLTQKERTIDDFVKDNWLCHTADGNIGLGVRSFLDLRGWFRTNDVPSCEVCNEAGIKTLSCPNEDCAVRIHDYCLKKKFSQSRSEKVCVSCGTEWPFQVTEEEAVKDEEEEAEPIESQARRPPRQRQSQASQGNNRKRLRSSGPVDSDDVGPSLRRTTRSSTQQR